MSVLHQVLKGMSVIIDDPSKDNGNEILGTPN